MEWSRPSPHVCCAGRIDSGASAVGGEWLSRATQLSCAALGTTRRQRLEQRNCRDKQLAAWGWVMGSGRCMTQKRIAAVATASFSSKADAFVANRVCMTQLTLLTPAQVWMKARLTPVVCRELILLMHIAVRCLSPVSACSTGRRSLQSLPRLEECRAWVF